MNKAPFTKEFLLQLFDYSPELGILIWKNHWDPVVVKKLKDEIAGNVCKQNHTFYKTVTINEKGYFIHKIIWFLENNEWCDLIDHIDGNGLNNSISNLRKSNQRLNMWNLKVHRQGRLQGCHFCKTTKMWRAQITIDKKRIHLGRFKTEKEAHEKSKMELKLRGLL